jgi:hypothetical protein
VPVAGVIMGDCDNYNESAFFMSWTPVEDSREVLKGRLKGYRVKRLFFFLNKTNSVRINTEFI